jgi:hypothetical protein
MPLCAAEFVRFQARAMLAAPKNDQAWAAQAIKRRAKH